MTFTPLTGEEAPDEIINRVSAMGGDEFAQLGQGGFNRINLPLGEKLRGNADGIASLEDALKKANDELAKAKTELGDNPTEQQIQNYVNLSAKPQFFNEALNIAKTEKPSAPPSEPQPGEASKPPLLPPEPKPAAPSAPVASGFTRLYRGEGERLKPNCPNGLKQMPVNGSRQTRKKQRISKRRAAAK